MIASLLHCAAGNWLFETFRSFAELIGFASGEINFGQLRSEFDPARVFLGGLLQQQGGFIIKP